VDITSLLFWTGRRGRERSWGPDVLLLSGNCELAFSLVVFVAAGKEGMFVIATSGRQKKEDVRDEMILGSIALLQTQRDTSRKVY